jgi:hypothetical protein
MKAFIRSILNNLASHRLTKARVYKARMSVRDRSLMMARELGRDDLVKRLEAL